MTEPLFEIAEMSWAERQQRVTDLIAESYGLLSDAEGLLDGHESTGKVILFSGGRDSTALAHLFRTRATHAAHCNTGIGIEATRQFVRDTCAAWHLPLLEKHPPTTYKDLVIAQGFPGPAMHWKMYTRLKERGLEQVRRDLVKNPRKQRVIFLAGRRRSESARRSTIPALERKGSIIWVSPMVNWTTLDLNTYRMMNPDIPINEVSNILHMSGECLCGAFAAPGERNELGVWFPEVMAEIEALEAAVCEARPDLPAHRKCWGWGATTPEPTKRKLSPLCTSCEWRQETLALDGDTV